MAGQRLNQQLDRFRRVLCVALCVSLFACAAPSPFLVTDARLDIPPFIAAEQDPGDIRVIWGGMIVGVKAIDAKDPARGSEIEVLAHPLDRRQRPLTRAPTEGRFVIRVPATLTRFDVPEGRFLTVRGRLIGAYDGYVGTTHYRYPILVDANWALWKQGFQYDDVGWAVGVGIAL